jgi:hypothetical protein
MRSVRCGLSMLTAVAGALLSAAGPSHATQAQTGAIKDFVTCLNTKIGQGSNADISATLQCLPASCTMTLTMSDESAQPACSLGGGDGVTKKCQLPRVILNCPGPPPFIPSYTLCPGSDGSNEHVNRVEIGVEVSRRKSIRLVMGDVSIPPGPYQRLNGWRDVISAVPDSKGCNECHEGGNENATKGAQQSIAIDTFGTSHIGTELAPYIIATNEPGRAIEPGPGLKAQSLNEICGCIDDAVNDDLHPLAANTVVQ